MTKIAIVGTNGVWKTKICEKILLKIWNSISNTDFQSFSRHKMDDILYFKNITFIPEQYREVVRDLMLPKSVTLKQTEEITLATYAKQLYLENLAQAQGKQAILCDRSVLDTFIYYDYFNKICNDNVCLHKELEVANKRTQLNYNKIYLIEPSDREIEDDGFRMIDKAQQLEIHKLFLEYFKDFDNVEIINQEDAWKDEFVDKVVNELI